MEAAEPHAGPAGRTGAVSPLDIAWRNLAAWPGLDDARLEGLREDMRRTDRDGGPSPRRRRMLLPAEDGDGFLFIAPHVGWKVLFVSLSPDLEVRQVEFRHAKCGYSVSWPGELVVTLHAHPGTGLFRDIPIRVSVEKGRLTLAELGPDAVFRPPALRER
jgi:hypothetical protein